MSLRLRALREDELPEYIVRGREAYAHQMVEHAGLTREAAEQKADSDWSKLLPDGVVQPGSYLFAVEEAETGERVGDLWYAERDGEFEGKTAFIYSIEILAAFRGRGYGRQAMLLLEDEVRSRGLPRISFNVFGGNEVARSLYRSLDYVETAVFMVKDL